MSSFARSWGSGNLRKEYCLVAVSALLALALLVGFTLFVQALENPVTPLSPVNGENTNDNTPLFRWDNVDNNDILNYRYRLVIDNSSSFNDGENRYDNSALTDNWDNFNTHTENALPEGVWYWKVRVENTTYTGDWSSTWSLRVDVTKPTVASVTLGPDSTITDADNNQAFNLDITFNDNMDQSVYPDIAFDENIMLDGTLTFTTRSWLSSIVCRVEYRAHDNNVENLDVDILVENAKDVAGNIQENYRSNDRIDVDTKNPTVVPPITVSDTLITDADTGSTFTITVNYSEPMSALNPSVAFSPSVLGTLINQSYSWPISTRCVVTYTVADNNVNVVGDDVIIENAKDANGNPQVSHTAPDNFDIDTQNPTVSSLVSSPALIFDNYVGVDNFTITITFNENMNEAVNPTITFTTSNVTSTLENVDNLWIDNLTFRARYDVADNNVNIVGVDFTVTGAYDDNGNLQVLYTATDNFDIDTQNPTVSSLVSSPALIFDNYVGVDNFTITITFNENMNEAVNPTITFTTSNVTSTLENVDNLWIDNLTFRARYDVADNNANIVGVDFTVTGAYDDNGNLQVLYTATDNFDIDTQNPILEYAFIDPDPSDGHNTYVWMKFSENVNSSSMAAGNFLITSPSQSISVAAGPTDNDGVTNDENISVKLDDVLQTGTSPGIKAPGITDLAGNYSVDNVIITTFRRTLTEGWSSVSFPIEDYHEDNIGSYFGDNTVVAAVWTYVDNTWTSYSPNIDNADRIMVRGGFGYEVKIITGKSLTLTPNVYNRAIAEYGGIKKRSVSTSWNMIGQYQEFDQTKAQALGVVTAGVNFKDYPVYGLEPAGYIPIENLQPGYGYWAWAAAGGTYGVGSENGT